MCRRKGSNLCILLAIVIGVTAKPPPPPGAPWAPYASKPVYYRSLGPSSSLDMGTVNVPFMSKSPMFPKFVDPKMMIAKKTEFLGNLFGSLGPVNFPETVEPENTPEKRGLFGSMMGPGGPMMGPGGPMMGPGGPMMGPGGPMGKGFPGGPMGKGGKFSPKFGKMGFPFGGFGSSMYPGVDDSTFSVSRRRRSLTNEPSTKESTKEVGPPPPYPGLATIPEEPEKQLLKLFGDSSAYVQSDFANNFDQPKSTVHEKRGLFGAFMMPYGFPAAISPFYNPMLPPMVNPAVSAANPAVANPAVNPLASLSLVNPMFNPFLPKYGVMPPNLPLGPSVDSSSQETSSRRRRSVDALEGGESPVPAEQVVSNPKAPVLKLPGMFGPFGPFGPMAGPFGPAAGPFGPMAGPFGPMAGPFGPMAGPFGPAAAPGMTPSKKAFLDALFKNLATTTPSPAVTDVPVPKSTIVPPNFWLPSSVIPGPTEYSEKVSKFLDKLFNQLALNVSLNAAAPENPAAATVKVARSVDDFTKIADAKDEIVDSILTELGAIKSNMVSTMNDLISYEKSVAFNPLMKKSSKNLAANLWPSPTIDATMPFQQRMLLLGQVFDMLTSLQKNITTSAQAAMKAQLAATEAPVDSNPPTEALPFFPSSTSPVFNTTLLDAIRNKISSIKFPSPAVAASSSSPSGFGSFSPKFARNAPSSFWVSHLANNVASKREVPEDQDVMFQDFYRNNQTPRGVKMQMHQGYQSMPPGAIETVQAGGNSVPGHQGGGINLHDMNNYNYGKKWAEWGDYVRSQFEGNNRHHHNRH
ncbi:collagen alpha-1(I) chain-like isoform X2 [Leptopilina heterotoma]|uniref:collagen alpha-1(I) chain-like isoform X2 n=1 Tax=Leptopilina heterotoma TaxID=63436 RepID=UPI001CA7E11E|nr:collagen alpha-1(I) chain-like isoform X2 [Leptopilina heterotoma]